MGKRPEVLSAVSELHGRQALESVFFELTRVYDSFAFKGSEPIQASAIHRISIELPFESVTISKDHEAPSLPSIFRPFPLILQHVVLLLNSLPFTIFLSIGLNFLQYVFQRRHKLILELSQFVPDSLYLLFGFIYLVSYHFLIGSVAATVNKFLHYIVLRRLMFHKQSYSIF